MSAPEPEIIPLTSGQTIAANSRDRYAVTNPPNSQITIAVDGATAPSGQAYPIYVYRDGNFAGVLDAAAGGQQPMAEAGNYVIYAGISGSQTFI